MLNENELSRLAAYLKTFVTGWLAEKSGLSSGGGVSNHDPVALSSDLLDWLSQDGQNLGEVSLAANMVLATPDGSSGVLSPRALVVDDLPAGIDADTLDGHHWADVPVGHDPVSFTAGAGDVFSLGTQEIGLQKQKACQFFGGPLAGELDAEPTFRGLDADDIPSHDAVAWHTYSGGAALDLFGLTAADTVGKITPSYNPVASAAILRTDANGGVRLLRLGIGTDPDANSRITMIDGGQIGQAAGPLVTFDDTHNYLEVTGCNLGLGTTAPATLLHAYLSNATTSAIDDVVTIEHASSGTPAAGFGAALQFLLESSTTAAQDAGQITASWVVATHASRTARVCISAADYGAWREGFRVEGSGTATKIGFFGGTAVVKQASLTTQLTTITHTAPGAEDFAIQDFVNTGVTAGWAFKDHNEANSVLKVIANLQTRLSELETRLINYSLLTSGIT